MKNEEELLDNLIGMIHSDESDESARAYADSNGLGEYYALLGSLKHEFDDIQVNESAMRSGKARLMTAISMSIASEKAKANHRASLIDRLIEMTKGLKPAYASALVASFAIAIAFIGTVSVSSDAVRGNSLYGVKTGMENIQLGLAIDTSDKAKLNLVFAERRLDEVVVLASQKQYQHIAPTLNSFEQNVANSVELSKSQSSSESQEISEDAHALIAKEEKVVSGILSTAPTSAKKKLAMILKDVNINKEKLEKLKDLGVNKDKNATKITSSDQSDDPGNTTTSVASGAGSSNGAGGSQVLSSNESEGLSLNIDTVTLSSGVVSPNNDGIKEALTVILEGQAGQDLFIEIISPGGVKVLTGDRFQAVDARSYSYTWTGNDQEGNYVPDGKYSIKIRNTSGVYASKQSHVIVDTNPPARPVIISPANGSTLLEQTIEFSWKDSSDVEYYNIQVASDKDFSEILRSASGLSSNKIALSLAGYEGHALVYWRIRAYDSAGNASSNASSSFVIGSSGGASGSTDASDGK